MKTDSVIKILFIESSVEDAEQIITLLRNAGTAVRPTRATTPEQIQEALAEPNSAPTWCCTTRR